jgi:hypothetical protein
LHKLIAPFATKGLRFLAALHKGCLLFRSELYIGAGSVSSQLHCFCIADGVFFFLPLQHFIASRSCGSVVVIVVGLYASLRKRRRLQRWYLNAAKAPLINVRHGEPFQSKGCTLFLWAN